jgi:pilus assembly protein CpaC
MRVINLMRIRDPQQVMLEVRIAEVSKDLLEKLGLSYTSLAKGQITSAISSGAISTAEFDAKKFAVTGGISSRVVSASSATGALSYLLTGKWSGVFDINAQKDDGLVKILAEPTLVAMSGKEGSFLSGGSVYIPVPTVSGSSPTLQQTEFGIRLKFLPTVLDNGRISLQVSPEVSEPILVNGQTGFSIRRVSSTVQMREGETLVIGGLIKDNLTESIKAFPLLGEIPILGALFRSTEFRNNKSELLVVVSPTLVRASTTMPALPTDSFVPPSRSELFLGGKLEGSGPPPVRGEEKNAPR